MRPEIFACLEIPRIVALFGCGMTQREPQHLRCRSLLTCSSPPRLTASPAKRIHDRRNSENVGPLIVRSGGSVPDREEALNNRPVFRDPGLLAAVLRSVRTGRSPWWPRLRSGHVRKFRELWPPFQGDGTCGERRSPARVGHICSPDGRSASATVAATVQSEYWGLFVSVGVA